MEVSVLDVEEYWKLTGWEMGLALLGSTVAWHCYKQQVRKAQTRSLKWD